MPTRIYLASGAAGATALLTMAGADQLVLAIAAAATLGCTLGAVAGAVLPQLQNNTPPSHMGRVMSMFYFLTAGLAPLSLAAMAALIEFTNTATGFKAAAVAAGGAAAIGYLGTRAAQRSTLHCPDPAVMATDSSRAPTN
ncbi:hypothetical protein GCM10022420_094820 [Streptomyces iranensis]